MPRCSRKVSISVPFVPGVDNASRLGHEIGHFAFALGRHWLMGDKNNCLDVSRLEADTRD
jgi:hypothetical protein